MITIEYGEYKLEPIEYWVSSRLITPYWFWQKWFKKYEWFVNCEYSSCGPFPTEHEARQFLAGISKHG